MPGDPARCVALRPALLHQGAALRWPAQDVGDGLSEGPDGGAVVTVRRSQAQSELSYVGAFGSEDVVRDLVTVAPATAGTLAQGGGGTGQDPIENHPGRGDQRRKPRGFGFRQRFYVPGGDLLGDTKIGGRTSPKMFAHEEGVGGLEPDARSSGDRRVARSIARKRGQRRGFVLSRPAPPRPVMGAGKDPLAARLNIDVGHARSALAE